jgi:hypothetical protein
MAWRVYCTLPHFASEVALNTPSRPCEEEQVEVNKAHSGFRRDIISDLRNHVIIPVSVALVKIHEDLSTKFLEETTLSLSSFNYGTQRFTNLILYQFQLLNAFPAVGCKWMQCPIRRDKCIDFFRYSIFLAGSQY